MTLGPGQSLTASGVPAHAVPGATPRSMPGAVRHPLCVDLDGTFITGDVSWFLLRRSLRARPAATVAALARQRGRSAVIKRWLSNEAGNLTDVISKLQVTQEVARFATDKAAVGTSVVLATGADQAVADAVRAAYPMFTRAIGSNGSSNFTGANKAAGLAKLFPDGFDYIGNAGPDIAVWRRAQKAYAWNCPARVLRRARALGIDVQVLQAGGGQPRAVDLSP